ncbi:MAG: flagellar basal-body rod protein FlgG [Lachnospiraceae bacterium]|nr:flagellar basal-body rod protein FlgG [Lachnospiraceae bacterium]
MMRSLWTAASGMISQQTNVDTIANNLANINTTGYKKETAQFKSLLYQTIQKKSYDSEGEEKPIGIQVGLGVRNSAIASQYTQGILEETGNDFDFALQGDGFFTIQLEDGSYAYTRNGSFQMTIGVNGLTMCDAAGRPVCDTNGNPIVLDPQYTAADVAIDTSGRLMYPDENNNLQYIGVQMGIAQFNNPAGLEKISDSLLVTTGASGEARMEATDPALKSSTVHQKYVEASNVSAVDEMVNLIVAQRAYEMNSKVITASDTMLQQANNLRS